MGQAAYDMTEVRRRRAPQTQRNVPLRVEKGGKPRLNPVRAAMQHALQLLSAALLVGFAVSLLWSESQLVELNSKIQNAKAELVSEQSQYDALEEGMDTIFEHLAPGGRLCIITFHSLEDRLVKNKFRRWATACTCPPEFPVCVCGGRAKAKLITRRPIEANTQELEENRRSRSAHLRVLEKI